MLWPHMYMYVDVFVGVRASWRRRAVIAAVC